ncbi:hypothetical protein F2Q68_00040678 [Brassica cretica]|uniref:Uncharacterized protein n=1 Tax=Brassica cretica TaxID=69181 RepID=A0A8S9MKE8_BRACR|nr:hypothetical protein F2Q68_00040678 [Brassica cretica]
MAAGCARRAESWSTRDVPERGDAERFGGRSVRRQLERTWSELVLRGDEVACRIRTHNRSWSGVWQRGLKLAPPLEEPVDGFRARYRSEVWYSRFKSKNIIEVGAGYGSEVPKPLHDCSSMISRPDFSLPLPQPMTKPTTRRFLLPLQPVPACVDTAQSLYPSKRSSLLR